jgi:hypothetical protein
MENWGGNEEQKSRHEHPHREGNAQIQSLAPVRVTVLFILLARRIVCNKIEEIKLILGMSVSRVDPLSSLHVLVNHLNLHHLAGQM